MLGTDVGMYLPSQRFLKYAWQLYERWSAYALHQRSV